MAIDKLIWGEEVKKEFEIKIKGKTSKIVLKMLNTEDTLAMELISSGTESTTTKQLLNDAIELLSRSIVSIDGQIPDSPAEIKELLLKRTEATDVFTMLGFFQKINEDIAAEIKK